MKKSYKYIKQVVNVLLIIFVVCFALVVCLQRFSNNEISFLNFRLFTVVSGSMAPEYEIGDVLLAQEREPSKIKVGDNISYLGTKGNFKDKVVTHQVVEIEEDKDGNLLFHTKGIANASEDPIVKPEQIYGVIVHEAKILSAIYSVVAKPTGMFIFVIIPVFYVIGSEFIALLLENDEEKINRAKKRKAEKEEQEEKNKKKTKRREE